MNSPVLNSKTASIATDSQKRWASIYNSIPLAQIPDHYRIFTAMPFLSNYLERVKQYCPTGGRVLETGIGFGYGAIWAAKRGFQAEGIDYSEDIVDRANLIALLLGARVVFRYGDMFELTRYIEGPFDVVFHQGVLEHYDDSSIRTLLEQQLRVSSTVIFSVPSKDYPFEREFGDERLMGVEEWRDILAPFNAVEICAYGDPALGAKEHILAVLRGQISTSARQSVRPMFLWKAPLLDTSGYAEEARRFVCGLTRIGVPVAARPINWSNRHADLEDHERRLLIRAISRPEAAGGVHVSHIFPPMFTRESNAALNIGRTMFETDRIPADWVAPCNQMDQIWVPSKFNLATFANSGVETDKLKVIPGAINSTNYDLKLEPLPVNGRRGYNFLSVFDWSLRKGWDILLRAYLEEFQPEEDVALIIKTYSSLGWSIQQIVGAASQAILGLGFNLNHIPDIVFHDVQLNWMEMLRLYRAADCYVMPSRGEGWGRPYMEAMAMGLPVIGTGWSGNTEFMHSKNSYLIEFDILPVSDAACAEAPNFRGHQWAEPRISHLKNMMRFCFNNRVEAREVGALAREETIGNYSEVTVAKNILAQLSADVNLS